MQSKDHSPSRRSILQKLKNVRMRTRARAASTGLLLTTLGATAGFTGSAHCASRPPANNDFAIDRTFLRPPPANDSFFVNEGA